MDLKELHTLKNARGRSHILGISEKTLDEIIKTAEKKTAKSKKKKVKNHSNTIKGLYDTEICVHNSYTEPSKLDSNCRIYKKGEFSSSHKCRPITESLTIALQTLLHGRDLDRKELDVLIDKYSSVLIHTDKLVEFHLQQAITALNEFMECQTAETDFDIIIDSLKFSLKQTYC